MPVLDRQAVRPPTGPAASLQGLPPRSVPEVAPTPLQKHYINLSVVVLICGAIAITALNLGARLGDPLIKLCVLVAAPLLVVTTADAIVRIWRSAWAWMPVDRGKGLFRLAWVAVSLVGLGALVVAAHRRPARLGRRHGAWTTSIAAATAARPTCRPAAASRTGWPSPSTSARTAARRSSSAQIEGEDRDRLSCPACGHIAYVNPRLVVTILPITDDGEIVLLRRGIEPGRGLWAQPGGFLEVDETVNQAADPRDLGGDRAARRAGRDHRAVYAPGGGRRDDRVRGADRRRDRGADPRGARDRGRSRRKRSRGRGSRSGRRPGRCATGWTGATRTSAGRRSTAGR